MAKHNDIGKAGEIAAIEYLKAKGYMIRHRNWRSGKKEIDIIAEYEQKLIIIEVKTRSSSKYEYPEHAINNKKIINLVRAADAYIRLFQIQNEVQFDTISIIGKPDFFTIEHIEDSFLPPIS